jgi:UDP-N-acetylglucosamine acyltransferase
MSRIHPTAQVHPTAVLAGDVVLGARSVIGPLCYVEGPVVIGEDTRLFPHVVMGCPGAHKTGQPTGTIFIGDRCMIRELAVVQRGTGDRDTRVGNDCFVMDHVHVAHDALVEDRVTLSPNIVLGGHAKVMEGATIGMGVVLHQFSTIGAYSMTGMGAVVTRDVPPFALVMGNPARFRRWNTHSLKHAGVDEGALRIVEGKLESEHPRVVELLRRFDALSIRPVMPLVPAAGDRT